MLPSPAPRASAVHVARAVLLIAALSMLLVSFGAYLISYHFLKEQTQRHLQTLAAFTASQLEPALRFGDVRTSAETLQAIPAAEGITLAELRDRDGELLARDVHAGTTPLPAAWLSAYVEQDVIVDGKRLGALRMQGGSEPMWRALFGLTVWFALGMLAIALCALQIARRYTRRFTAPIDEFRTVVQRLIEDRDFRQRAPTSSLAEVEALRVEFNQLLEEISLRDRLLTESNETLRRVAYLDALTGLPNRALLQQSLVRLLVAAAPHGKVGVFYLDLDGFKAVNDALGHAVGDALLAQVGVRLRSWRPQQSVAARIGGDEFVVVVSPGAGDDFAGLAKELQALLDAPIDTGALRLWPGISIGLAVYPDMAQDTDQLIHLADRAMYAAKDVRARRQEHTRWERRGAEQRDSEQRGSEQRTG